MNKHGRLLRPALLAAALTALFFTLGASAATYGGGVVTADALRLRAEPNTSCAILATAPADSGVVILADKQDGWYKVNYGGVDGYMSADYLDVSVTVTADLGCGVVDTEGSTLNLRSTSSTDGDRLASIPDGTALELKGIDNGWFAVEYGGQKGYVSSDYIKFTSGTSISDGLVPLGDVSLAQQIVNFALQFEGYPYIYGTQGPSSFDCSGLTCYVYAHFGYSLNRSASGQLANGTPVPRDQLQPGDLVLFQQNSNPASHVGLYIGNNMFIHASEPGVGVIISPLNDRGVARNYCGARRII